MNLLDEKSWMAMVVDKLIQLNLEEYIEEVIRSIGWKNSQTDLPSVISEWSVDENILWLEQINFSSIELRSMLLEKFKQECIDGYTLENMTEQLWIQYIKLDASIFHLLKTIIQAWSYKLTVPSIEHGAFGKHF